MFLLEGIGVGWSAPHTDGEQVLGRHTKAEPAGKPSCGPKDAASGDGWCYTGPSIGGSIVRVNRRFLAATGRSAHFS